jgi:hypothetical protein
VCSSDLSSVLPCTSLLSFIHAVYMNIFSDNHAITLATRRCFRLVDIVQTGMEKKRTVKGKAVPLQAWSGPEGSRKLRFPDFMTKAQDGGKFVSFTQWPLSSPRKYTWYSFLLRLSRPQGHSATGRIMSLKNSSDIIGNRTRDLPVCSVVRKE